jgi:hypothetical protein
MLTVFLGMLTREQWLRLLLWYHTQIFHLLEWLLERLR